MYYLYKEITYISYIYNYTKQDNLSLYLATKYFIKPAVSKEVTAEHASYSSISFFSLLKVIDLWTRIYRGSYDLTIYYGNKCQSNSPSLVT